MKGATMEITREIALKVRETVAAGLVNGMGRPEPGHMCVEAAVCYAMGLPHSDRPTCVSPAIRALKIALNDKLWSSNEARAKGLARLALVQLGSADAVDDREFSRRVAEMMIRVFVPVALRAAARRNPKHAEAMEAAAVKCERDGTVASAREAQAAADAAADAAYAADAAAYAACAADAAADAYAYAADDAAAASAAAADAAYAAACAAADAAYAADAADAAAYAADAAAAYAAAAADAASTRDRVLADFAERVVQILVEIGAPGAQWLNLSPLEVVNA